MEYSSSEGNLDDMLFQRRSMNETELAEIDKKEESERFFNDLEKNISMAGTTSVFSNPILQAEDTKMSLEHDRQIQLFEEYIKKAGETNDEAKRYRLFTDYMTSKNRAPTLDKFELFGRLIKYQQRLEDPTEHKAEKYRKIVNKLHEEFLGYLPADPPEDPPEKGFRLKTTDSTDSDDLSNYTVSKPEPERVIYERCGIFEIPVPEQADFDRFDADMMQASETAFDSWDMFKVTEIMEDGGLFETAPLIVSMECEDIFSYMRNNTGLGWIEAMGGADHYLLGDAKPCVPTGAVPLSKEIFYSEVGWIPKQDRMNDGDLFNTTYIRPSQYGTPIYSDEIPDKEGYWRVRAMGPYVVFSNIYNLCEIFLTPQGFFMLGGLLRYSRGPQALRVEYGLAGCVSGYNKFFCLSNTEARKILGLPCPQQVIGEASSIQALRKWTEVCGWHDLERRLFKRGKTEQDALNEIIREIKWREEIQAFIDPEAPMQREFFEYKDGYVQLKGVGQKRSWTPRPNKFQLLRPVDLEADERQVLWRMGQGFQLDYPWASENFVLKFVVAGGKKRVIITSKQDGKAVAEYDGMTNFVLPNDLI
ncbi:hypothetical protein GUITHDRAFT_100649 [Guillardia theta CCMP2712]|uniref:Uncharacterized protein n=1 Tax=Guillardia theta (strain CCMP2712) TaxID=905079 RepID=L1JYL5_GUITC|nr:hypothetical protein GUITHDRAFT_100649 [Guillardia theta CCMP2712]EKX53671.1 hypothetical protein GUITHDRAFT_100649 [Guillardia theta CCMP2712]|eukprot:XP_005840651.1 hypothetical protein GUITHDRAFT_100649 [Guillardia theta CCMP2712]